MSLKSLSHPYFTRICEVEKRVHVGGKILDVGCADGILDSYLVKKGSVYGIDINKTEIEIAKIRNPDAMYQIADIMNLPFKDSFFDTVICSEVLEHIRDHVGAVAELKRILKKNGKLIITVPYYKYPSSFDIINYVSEKFGFHFPFGIWAYGHLRTYSEKDMKILIKKNGLKIVETAYLSRFLVGFIEPTYIINLIQPFFKSDKLNRDATPKDIMNLKRRILKRPHHTLEIIRDKIIDFDKKLFSGSTEALGLLVVAKK